MKQIYSPNLTGDDVQVVVRLPRRFARGGLATAAESVRKAGRYGDDMLVHMNKDEFAMLKRAWGEPTYHPRTGMPEYFSWGDALRGLGDYATGNWGDLIKTGVGAIGGALDKKASADMGNKFPAPPVDPNLSTHLGGNAKNARTAIPLPVMPPQSYYTRGQYPEKQLYSNNSMAALTNTPGAQVQPLKYDVPSTGSMIAGSLGNAALNYALTHGKDIWAAMKGASSAASGAGSGAGGAGLTGFSSGDLTALTGEGNAASMGAGAGTLPGATLGSAMTDTGVPISTIGTLPAEGGAAGGAGAGTGAGSTATSGGLGTAAAGVGSFLALAALGKHLQDNTAGLGYNESRQLASGLAANATAPDPTHGNGRYASTPMPAPPQGFKTWNQYFYATQMIQQAQHASGGAKDQGTYRMLLQEAGLPTDPSFYMQAHPGQDIAWQAIMGHSGVGTPGAGNMRGKARGGLAYAEGGAVRAAEYPRLQAGPPPTPTPTIPSSPYERMDFCDVPGKPYRELCHKDPVTGKRIADRPGYADGGPVYTQNTQNAAMSGAGNLGQSQLGLQAAYMSNAANQPQLGVDQGHPTPPQQAGPMGNFGNGAGNANPMWDIAKPIGGGPPTGWGAAPPAFDGGFGWGNRGLFQPGGAKPAPGPSPWLPNGQPNPAGSLFDKASGGTGIGAMLQNNYGAGQAGLDRGASAWGAGRSPTADYGADQMPGDRNLAPGETMPSRAGANANYGAGQEQGDQEHDEMTRPGGGPGPGSSGPLSQANYGAQQAAARQADQQGNLASAARPPQFNTGPARPTGLFPTQGQPGMPPQGMPPIPPRAAPVPSPAQQANPALYGRMPSFPGQPRPGQARPWGSGALARATGGPVHGPGTGTSDDIPARLSNGEYVIPAHIVAALGDGSTMAGAKRLDELQRQVRLLVGRQMASNRHPKPSPPPLALIGRQ